MSHRYPRDIWAMLLPDGRVQLTLYDARSGILDRRVQQVKDTDTLQQTARDWAVRDWAQPSATATPSATADFHHGLGLIIGARGTSSEFADYRGRLQLEFGRLFGDVLVNKPRVERPESGETRSFAVALSLGLDVTFRRLRRTAERRLAGGRYLPVLEYYLEQLRSVRDQSQQHFYEAEEHGLIGLLRGERYLLLADDPKARTRYAAIAEEISHLYNWHMDLAKGGVRRGR